MVRRRWKGWIDPKDVAPEMMERFRLKTERYYYYVKNLGGKDLGTGNYMLAHLKAESDVGLTKHDEVEILGRLHPDALKDVHDKYR